MMQKKISSFSATSVYPCTNRDSDHIPTALRPPTLLKHILDVSTCFTALKSLQFPLAAITIPTIITVFFFLFFFFFPSFLAIIVLRILASV